ncbi:MAG TPA: hypothetical protein VK849_07300 [Longimicrobiales bacterium]|nr:hypothetical protein [Longimicrobiales bacterium]
MRAGPVTRLPARALAVAALAGGALSAQEPPPGPGARVPGGYALQATLPRPVSTVAAASVRLPHGSADDPQGLEGMALLLAHMLESTASDRLGAWGATVTSEVGRTETVFTLLVPVDGLRPSLAVADSVLFRTPLDAETFQRRRQEAFERLAFEAGSPIREYEAEAAYLLVGSSSPWARPAAGTPTSVEALTLGALEAFRREHVQRALAALAVVGPGLDTDARAGAPADTTGAPVASPDTSAAAPPPADTLGPPADTLSPPADTVAPAAAPTYAWSTADRLDLVRDVTNTWIQVGYPVPAGFPRTDLEVLAHALDEELDPTPPDPDRYSVSVRLERLPGGPVLLVEAAVLPEAADRWERRILSAVERLASGGMHETLFAWQKRRARSARLLAEAAPEAAARRAAEDLLREGRVRDLEAELAAMDVAGLSRAAESLGEPRVLRFGPDLGAQDAERARHGGAYTPGPA